MKTPLIALFAITLLPFSLIAQEKPAVRPDIAELLKLTEVEQQMQASMTQMKQMMLQNVPAGNAEAKEAMSKGFDVGIKEFTWDKIGGDIAAVYAEVFTPEEVNGLVAFFKTPVGQSFLKKQPVLMEKVMQVTQKRMTDVMPKIQAEVQAEMQKLQKAKEAK